VSAHSHNREAGAFLRIGGIKISKDEFWKIIDGALKSASGTWQDMYEPLLESLSGLKPGDIIRWQLIFDEYQHLSYKEKLWGAAMAMMNGCSDDSFDYFRGWLIAQGRDAFLGALLDPDSLANLETVKKLAIEMLSSDYTPLSGYLNNPRFESILSVAADAYESKPDNGDFYDSIKGCSLTKSEKASIAGDVRYSENMDVKMGDIGTPWPETLATLQNVFPRLYGQFHNPPASKEREPARRESVLDKLREGKKESPFRNPKSNKHKQAGPER
jgi:hypothetical protein